MSNTLRGTLAVIAMNVIGSLPAYWAAQLTPDGTFTLLGFLWIMCVGNSLLYILWWIFEDHNYKEGETNE